MLNLQALIHCSESKQSEAPEAQAFIYLPLAFRQDTQPSYSKAPKVKMASKQFYHSTSLTPVTRTGE